MVKTDKFIRIPSGILWIRKETTWKWIIIMGNFFGTDLNEKFNTKIPCNTKYKVSIIKY